MRIPVLGVLAFAASLTLCAEPRSLCEARARASLQNTVPGHSSSILKIGEKAPGFGAIDQFGKERDFANLRGPNGLVMLFFRSADW